MPLFDFLKKKEAEKKESAQKIESVFVGQQKFITFNIGPEVPYQIFEAPGLIFCGAFIFRYNTPSGQEKGILYHALSGIPNELKQIKQIIEADGAFCKDVSITMTHPNDSKVDEEVIKRAKRMLEAEGFNPPVIKEEIFTYSVDTRGNEGVKIPKISMQNISNKASP